MIVVGHRGCAAIEPENTLRAFRRAIELGCDMVECDVRLTRDGHLAIIHDERVDRTTNGSGPVADFTLAELHALDAGKGERIPTLPEVLEVVRGHVEILVELKGEGTPDPAVEVVRSLGMTREVVLTCFDLARIRRVKEIDASLRTGAIFGEPPPDAAAQATAAGAEGMGVNHRHQSRALIDAAHAQGLRIRAWNPDTEPEMRAMIDLGVDGIGSNRPDLLLGLLGRLPGPGR